MGQKRLVALAVMVTLFCAVFLPSKPAWAWGDEGVPRRDLEATFDHLYPKAFFKTTLGKIIIIGGSAVVVGVITFATAGGGGAAAAGPIATWVGAAVGAAKGFSGIAALNCGLAFFGGGSIASGGFGILGGVTVLNVVGDLALGVALEGLTRKIPSNNMEHGFLNLLKMKMFQTGIDPGAEDLMKKVASAVKDTETMHEANAAVEELKLFLRKSLAERERKDRGYDHLLLAVLEFNTNNFDEAKRHLGEARVYFDKEKSSFIHYMDGLLYLVYGKDALAERAFQKAIEQEPKAVPPYVVFAQTCFDNHKREKACSILKKGLDEGSKKDFSLNWMLGEFLYEIGRYNEAPQYYKKALSGTSINEMEAMCKLKIAKCYLKTGELKESREWLMGALKESKKNDSLASEVLAQYNEG